MVSSSAGGESVVHELAKPVARTIAWTSVLAAFAALIEGARRNISNG